LWQRHVNGKNGSIKREAMLWLRLNFIINKTKDSLPTHLTQMSPVDGYLDVADIWRREWQILNWLPIVAKYSHRKLSRRIQDASQY